MKINLIILVIFLWGTSQENLAYQTPPVPNVNTDSVFVQPNSSSVKKENSSLQHTLNNKTQIATPKEVQSIVYPKISVPTKYNIDIMGSSPTIRTEVVVPTNNVQNSKDVMVIDGVDNPKPNVISLPQKTQIITKEDSVSIKQDVQDIKKNSKPKFVKPLAGKQIQNLQVEQASSTNIEKQKKEKEISDVQAVKEPVNDSNNIKLSTDPISPDKADEIAQIRDNARVLYNAGKTEDAKNEFAKISDSEKVSDDWLFLGNIAIDENKLVDAIFFFKKAIQLDDENFKAHFNLGNLYLADNKINSALNEYRKVLKINKNYAYAHYNKGCCYLKSKNYFNARYEFGLAIRSNPNEPAFYYNLAYTNKMMGKTKKAQEALDMYNQLMRE